MLGEVPRTYIPIIPLLMTYQGPRQGFELQASHM